MSTGEGLGRWTCDCGARSQAETCPVCGWTQEQQVPPARQPGRKARLVVGIGLVLALSIGVTVVAVTLPDPGEALAVPGSSDGQCQDPDQGEQPSPTDLSEVLLDLSGDDYEFYEDESGPLDLEEAAHVAGNRAAARVALQEFGFLGGELKIWSTADGLILANGVFQFPEGEDACRYLQVLARSTKSNPMVDLFVLEGVPDSLAVTINQTEKTDQADPYFVRQVLFPKSRHVYWVALVRTGGGTRPTQEELAELAREQLARG